MVMKTLILFRPPRVFCQRKRQRALAPPSTYFLSMCSLIVHLTKTTTNGVDEIYWIVECVAENKTERKRRKLIETIEQITLNDEDDEGE